MPTERAGSGREPGSDQSVEVLANGRIRGRPFARGQTEEPGSTGVRPPAVLNAVGLRALQRLAGNSAVAGLLEGRRGSIPRDAAPVPKGGAASIQREVTAVQRDGPADAAADRGATPAPVSHDAEGYQAPPPELMQAVTNRIMSDVFSV